MRLDHLLSKEIEYQWYSLEVGVVLLLICQGKVKEKNLRRKFFSWLCEAKTIFRWRCAQGTHPFSSRTRWLRPERPMVLHWRRCGRVGGCRIKKISASNYGGVAQLGEHLPCKQGVKSSNLSVSTGKKIKDTCQAVP